MGVWWVVAAVAAASGAGADLPVDPKLLDFNGPRQPPVVDGVAGFEVDEAKRMPILYDKEGRPMQPPVEVQGGQIPKDSKGDAVIQQYIEAMKQLQPEQPPIPQMDSNSLARLLEPVNSGIVAPIGAFARKIPRVAVAGFQQSSQAIERRFSGFGFYLAVAMLAASVLTAGCCLNFVCRKVLFAAVGSNSKAKASGDKYRRLYKDDNRRVVQHSARSKDRLRARVGVQTSQDRSLESIC